MNPTTLIAAQDQVIERMRPVKECERRYVHIQRLSEVRYSPNGIPFKSALPNG
jgi:hypothetical protein